VIAADPKHTKAHYALAWVLLDQKDKTGAATEFRKVIELAPESEEAKEAQKTLERIR
jgi:Tfp pilus assembly protein PilF